MFAGALLLFKEELQIGEWVALLFLISGILPALSRSVTFNTQLKEALEAFSRLQEIMELPAENLTTNGRATSAIEHIAFRNVQFSFPGQLPLLEHVNFELKPNCITALTGLSGCGKSTLLEILQRVHLPDSGNITINHQLLDQWDLRAWRAKVAVVPQQVRLFQTSLAQNISMDLKAQDIEKVRRFCQARGFHKHLGNLYEKMHYPLGAGGLQLSGGEGQLVAWARALYRKPQVLLLDEATTFLDGTKKAFVMNLMQAIKSHAIILMVTHDVQIQKMADQVVEL